MILALATSVLSLGLGQAPAPATLPVALEGRNVTTLVQASPTHIAAENLSTEPQLLLVGDRALGALAQVVLYPGQRIEHFVSSAARTQLWIEVVTRGQAYSNSGAYALADLHPASEQLGSELWLEQVTSGLRAWSCGADGDLRSNAPLGGLLPSSARIPYGELGLVDHALHVPGAPPTGGKKGDTPPEVPDKNLPPF